MNKIKNINQFPDSLAVLAVRANGIETWGKLPDSLIYFDFAFNNVKEFSPVPQNLVNVCCVGNLFDPTRIQIPQNIKLCSHIETSQWLNNLNPVA